MRIDSLGRTIAGPSAARSAMRGAGAFTLAESSETETTRQAAPVRQAHSLGSLLALQAFQEDEPRERRRRALSRGRGLLDVLDGLKLALIEGRDDPAALRALAAQLGATRADTGEAGLDEALAAIDLRAQVELAKRGA
ncbi:flagellar assembly protein FliX [Chelatococcus sambhunathii]|uniref:Flagellar assembly protein FliX n=1 Tax=Chelatococcus sambhunathii TaxID=363953 RepID=A0ABU1DKN3_9HYPH|nr:flagellar assembly protein FliX [Chelatococcus sambhunathii]MDR4308696.1 flagellar assembly protein FliX [Chelatococcus sambhunathii]